MDNPFVPTLLVAKALEAVGTAYCIGGSLASGIYGLGRATMDADLVAPLQEGLDPITGESAYFAAPEDIILAKLDWYIKSGHSERQWQDILGIIKTQGLRLDLAYLKHWAETLGLRDELRRALTDGELPD